MTRLPPPPGFPVVLREEFRTALHGMGPALRVGAALSLLAVGIALAVAPGMGFLLPTPLSPIPLDFGILAAFALAWITWHPAGEHSNALWIGVRPQPIDPARRIVARALSGSCFALLAGVLLLAVTATAPLISGHGSVGISLGSAAALLSSMVVAYLFWSLCTVSGPRVTVPAAAVGAGVLWVLLDPDGTATTEGVRWWLMEGAFAPGAALLGASLPAALLWGSVLLLLLPYTARLDASVDGTGGPDRAASGRSTFGLHLKLLLRMANRRYLSGAALAAPIGGIVALESQGADLFRPLTWGVALDFPFLAARGVSVFFVIMLVFADMRSYAPSSFRALGALPVSRRRYLLSRAGAMVAIGLAGALILHLAAACWTVVAGEPMASLHDLAHNLWLLLGTGMLGIALVSLSERPVLLWVGFVFAFLLVSVGLMALSVLLEELTGGAFPARLAWTEVLAAFRYPSRTRRWILNLIALLPVAGAAWYATGSGPMCRAV